jgi:hypothetical protein
MTYFKSSIELIMISNIKTAFQIFFARQRKNEQQEDSAQVRRY